MGEDCLKCAKRMNGRSFDGNILQVELAGSFLDENLQSNERVLDRDAVETEIEQRENIEQNENISLKNYLKDESENENHPQTITIKNDQTGEPVLEPTYPQSKENTTKDNERD